MFFCCSREVEREATDGEGKKHSCGRGRFLLVGSFINKKKIQFWISNRPLLLLPPPPPPHPTCAFQYNHDMVKRNTPATLKKKRNEIDSSTERAALKERRELCYHPSTHTRHLLLVMLCMKRSRKGGDHIWDEEEEWNFWFVMEKKKSCATEAGYMPFSSQSSSKTNGHRGVFFNENKKKMHSLAFVQEKSSSFLFLLHAAWVAAAAVTWMNQLPCKGSWWVVSSPSKALIWIRLLRLLLLVFALLFLWLWLKRAGRIPIKSLSSKQQQQQ